MTHFGLTNSFNEESRLLAAATNGGLLYTLTRSERGPPLLKKTYKHEPFRRGCAIFDIRWSKDDQKIALGTASSEALVLDVEKDCITSELQGNTRSQKVIKWCDKDASTLASGDRDGTICIWDVREQNSYEHTPACRIKGAHGPVSARTAVTDILFGDENIIYSSGSANALLKRWDLRMIRTQENEGSTSETTSPFNPSGMDVRPRGVVAIQDITYGRILVMARDSRIYTYAKNNLIPEETWMTDQSLRANSPFASMETSRCQSWVAAGGAYGTVAVFNIEKLGSRNDTVRRPKATVLEAENGEINGLSWCDTAIATGADDGTVRLWRIRGRY